MGAQGVSDQRIAREPLSRRLTLWDRQ